MPKKTKLELNELSIESFTLSLDKLEGGNVKRPSTTSPSCYTYVRGCPSYTWYKGSCDKNKPL